MLEAARTSFEYPVDKSEFYHSPIHIHQLPLPFVKYERFIKRPVIQHQILLDLENVEFILILPSLSQLPL